MHVPARTLFGVMLFASLAACSSNQQRSEPIEWHDNSGSAGESAAAKNLQDCQSEVRLVAPMSIQPRWLPSVGAAENGVVLGTVDSPHPVWTSRDAYRKAMQACLTARGFDIQDRK